MSVNHEVHISFSFMGEVDFCSLDQCLVFPRKFPFAKWVYNLEDLLRVSQNFNGYRGLLPVVSDTQKIVPGGPGTVVGSGTGDPEQILFQLHEWLHYWTTGTK